MDSSKWPQEIGFVKPMEEMVTNTFSRSTTTTTILGGVGGERKTTRPQKEQALNCLRCNSANTKFCYYNNYSLTQPRYFCKTCKRYWTEGGSVRNVPVGGASRKNKRSSSTSTKKFLPADLTQPSSSTTTTTQTSSHHLHQNPKIIQGQDLNIGFPIRHEFTDLPNFGNNNNSSTNSSSHLSALELLRTSEITSKGFISSPGFDHLQDFKPTLNFAGLDELGNGEYCEIQGTSATSSVRVSSFPFEDLGQVSSTSEFEQNKGQGDANGYWSGMLGGGSW